jgi:hypothetical protein
MSTVYFRIDIQPKDSHGLSVNKSNFV